jgi:molybdate transport system substrate-binding protein
MAARDAVMRGRRRLAALAAVAVLVTACAAGGGGDGLTVFAAASLRAVSAELEAAWTETHANVPLTFATEASNVLAAQIAEGAKADVFLSADELRPRELADTGHGKDEPVPFAANVLTLVVRPDGPVREPADLADPGVRLVIGGPSTPIGRYTLEALDALAASMPDPADFAAAIEANIASHEDNVRATLAKVELGEGDAAFVYRTDALSSDDVLELELPPAARVGATYAALRISDDPMAGEFLEWLSGPVGLAILAEAGFEAPT